MNDATKETSNELEQDIEISNCKKGKTILNDFQCVPEVNDSTKNGVDKTQPESFNSCKTDEESKDIESGRNVVSTENDSSAKTSANGVEIETSSPTVDLNSTVDSFIRNNQESLDVKKQITATQKGDKNLSNLLTTLSINDDNNPEKKIVFVPYWNEEQLPDLVALITQDLSEPYSVYTYRYFLHNWPHLSDLAYCGSECVGAIVCKLDVHRKSVLRGYIAMLVVHKSYRRCKIGSSLVRRAILKMIDHGCEEVVLETEVTNKAALELYENLGFVRDKRLLRYYLNGVDAWRLKLWLK